MNESKVMREHARHFPSISLRTHVAPIAAVFAAVVVAASAVSAGDAWAGSSSLKFKQSGEGTGRVYDPSRLRTKKTGPAPGRVLRNPPIPEPENPRQLRSTAKIPSPEPRGRGGSGYARRGKYFYEIPEPPELTRTAPNARLKASIPNPESPPHRRKSAAAH
jgi:hypothetical protein